jgi:hypothetical protein
MKKPQILILISIALLLIANFSFWLSSTIYNPQNFSSLVVETYQQQDVRDAIAAEIVDNTLESKPLVRQVIGGPVQSAISGLLSSQAFESVLSKAAVRFQNYLTTNNRQDVTIEVGQVATFIKAAATTVSPQLGEQVPDVSTEKITLVKANSLPNINKWLKPIMTIGPIVGMIGLVIIGYVIYVSENRWSAVKQIGLYLFIGTILFALLIPYFRTILQGNITDSNAEIVATATYDTFAGILARLLVYYVLIAVAMFFTGFFLEKPKLEKNNNSGRRKEK